jgi:hypothetical protein
MRPTRTGHNATPAVSMLNALEHGLHAFEQHREVILELLAQEIARKSGTCQRRAPAARPCPLA